MIVIDPKAHICDRCGPYDKDTAVSCIGHLRVHIGHSVVLRWLSMIHVNYTDIGKGQSLRICQPETSFFKTEISLSQNDAYINHRLF